MENFKSLFTTAMVLGGLACSSTVDVQDEKQLNGIDSPEANTYLSFGLIKDGPMELLNIADSNTVSLNFDVSLRCEPGVAVSFWNSAYVNNPLKDAAGSLPLCGADGKLTQKVAFKPQSQALWTAINATQTLNGGKTYSVSVTVKVDSMGDTKPSIECPKSLNDITSAHVPNLAKCKEIQPSLCTALCGESFKKQVIRPIFQDPMYRDGLLCFDDVLPKSLPETCKEIHGGSSGAKWCVNYNLDFKGTKLGALVQCVQKVAKASNEL